MSCKEEGILPTAAFGLERDIDIGFVYLEDAD